MAPQPAVAQKYWIWVFGDIAGLRWVLQRKRMAFPESAGRRVASMTAGDRAILYLTRGALHSPTRDVSRLGGVVTVVSAPHRGKPVEIAGRDFTWFVGIRPETLLPERQGPEVRLVAAQLDLVKRPGVWGQYSRTTPIDVGKQNSDFMAAAIAPWKT